MAQCQGTTKKGDQCKREGRDDSPFCSVHQDQEIRARSTPKGEEWDREAIMAAAVGFGLIGLLILFRIRR
ncbi:MAG: hypothetical protein V3S01_04355 [Dehalococcoidia bacterium]